MNINPGKLNKRVNICTKENIADGLGGFGEGYRTLNTVWANIRPVGGKEYAESKSLQAEITHKITMRYTEAVNRTHTLMQGNRKFEIQYIININDEYKYIQLHVLEVI